MANEKVISSQALIEKFRQALADEWGYIWGTAGEKWTAAKQKELEKTTDTSRAMSRKYGKKWIGHMVADCSGLFSWAFKQLGGYMYHGSDTMYRKYCAYHGELNKGKRTDGATLKPGTAVFVWNGEKYSHVGLFVGDGIVIEAMGAQNGVTTTKVTATKWTHWGELKGVDYSGITPEPDPQPDQKPTLRKGDSGTYVTLAQTMLIQRGYSCGSCGADGKFGNDTQYAVKKFQMDHALQVDGVIGQATWTALEDTTDEVQLYTVHIPCLPLYKAEAMVSQYDGAYMTKEESDSK